MSSKYSEFRKANKLNAERAQKIQNAKANTIDINEINEMIQVLAMPLILPAKPSQPSQRIKRSSFIEDDSCSSASLHKGSQTNQTCDLTTNNDYDSVNNNKNQQLQISARNSSRRFYTQRQSNQAKSQIRDQSFRQFAVEQFKTQQSLLDEFEEDKQTNNLITIKQKTIMFEKLKYIEQKLNNKKISFNKFNQLLTKLNCIQKLIDQI